MWFKRFTVALLIGLLATAALSTGAEAHRRGNKKSNKSNHVGTSDVTIGFTDQEPVLGLTPLFLDRNDYFSGTISKVKDCDGKQVVEVLRGGGGSVGSTVAAANGNWALQVEDPGTDTYIAKVTGSNKRENRVCARGTSASLDATDTDSNLLGIPDF